MSAVPGIIGRFLISRLGVPRFVARPLPLFGLMLSVLAPLIPWRLGVVVGHSMEPTLRNHTPFFFDQRHYREHPIRRGEIVVVRDASGTWVKRVYAVGGETFLAWQEPRDGYIRHDPIAQTQGEYFQRLAADQRRKGAANCRVVRLKVPNDCLFLVGDGAVSEDSRMRGYVRAENVIGRVLPFPGQTLGGIPNWVELSSPRANGIRMTAGKRERSPGIEGKISPMLIHRDARKDPDVG